jgi:glutaredoxin 3
MSMLKIEAEGARVKIFSTTYCGWCTRAQELLSRNGIPFETIDVTGNAEARRALRDQANGRRTVPVIFIDGAYLGGYQELAHLLASGGLDGFKGGFPNAA